MNWFILLCSILLFACLDPEAENRQAHADTLKVMNDTFLRQARPATSVVNDLIENISYLSFTAEAKDVKMYWKHSGAIIKTFEKLKQVEPNLVFAMNGGMYMEDYSPVGLYVENGKQLRGIKRYNNPKLNFGMQPQGIFLIRDTGAEVIPIDQYKPEGVTYATQSAPMVVLNSAINPKLPDSKSRNIRNGVGMLRDGKVLMAISRVPVTFREFARYFVDQGCTSALYLDGGISEAYVPQQETYGSFGVLIGVVGK